VICNGNSTRQNQAIAQEIEVVLSAGGLKPSHVEGLERGEWILMDYLTMVIHIFSPEKRRFYDLEQLWADAPRIPPPV
jgi:ribosome-associated protein